MCKHSSDYNYLLTTHTHMQCAHTHNAHTHTHTHTHTHKHTHTRNTHTYAQWACMQCTHTHTRTHTHTHTHERTHMHTHTHTCNAHTHTHTHTHMCNAHTRTHKEHTTPDKQTSNQTAADSHGGGLPSPVVSQEGGDLILVEVDGQSVHCQLLAIAVNLAQVSNCHPYLVVARLSLHALVVLWWKGTDGTECKM